MWGEEETKELESQTLAFGSWRVATWDCNPGTKRVTNREIQKWLPSKIVTVNEIELEIIFFLLGFLNLEKLFLNCRTNSEKKNSNDIVVNVAQLEHNNIKCYASAFSNI